MRPLARLQRALDRQLESKAHGRTGLTPVNWILVGLILLSIALYTMDPENEVEPHDALVFWWINRIIVVAFAVEFVARLWVAGTDSRYQHLGGRLAYLRANWFMVTIDLLAFMPELIYVVLGLPAPSWLRVLRLIRLFKLARYFQAFSLIVNTVRDSIQPLMAAIFAAALLWYLAGVFLYLAEHGAQPEKIASVGDAMWLSIMTLTSVGYGDVYPVTIAGRIIAGLVAVLGVGTVALPSGIIAGAFMHQIREREKMVRPDAASAPPPGDG
jgi:voltage-gated potassium channel